MAWHGTAYLLAAATYYYYYYYYYYHHYYYLWSAANGLAKAIALLQLFSLREFDGSRTQSLKVPRVPPRKDCRRRATKSKATYVCRAHLALPSNKVLEPKYIGVLTN